MSDSILGFPLSRFRDRRDRTLELLGSDALVLAAASPQIRAGDSELPYRPDSNVFYLTGLREPEAVLVLRGFADEARTVLFVRPRDAAAEQWSGLRVGPEAAPDRFGVDEAHPIETIESRLPGLLTGARRVLFRLGETPRVERLVVEALQTSRTRGSRRGEGPRTVTDPGEVLHELRLRKDPDELEAIRQAAHATVAGFRRAAAEVRPGAGEWEVEAELVAAFRRTAAGVPAFAPIVASGPNACILHYTSNERRMEAGELVLIDAGAEVRLYAGDVTRTLPASGSFGPEQREVYAWVEEARRAAVAAIRAGEPVEAPHRAAGLVLARALVELGLLEGEPEEIVEAGRHRRYYPHQTCHWIGLDTHDPGDYTVEGASRLLEPGMTLTVEPGLYFPPWTEPEVAGRFGGIGIRIEDTVLVTDRGPEVLSGDLPTDPDAVAVLVGAAG